MKKIYVFLLLLFPTIIRSDDLSDAIRASDIDTVRMVLARSHFTSTQLLKYLDTATHIVRMRLDNLELGTPPHSKLRCPNDTKYRIISAVSLAWGLSSIACGIVGIVKDKEELKGLSFFGLFSAFYTFIISHLIERGEINRMLHSNALSIREMIYDSFDTPIRRYTMEL